MQTKRQKKSVFTSLHVINAVEPFLGHLSFYSGRSLWPRLHSNSGLYFRNPCNVATSLLWITAITSPPTKQN